MDNKKQLIKDIAIDILYTIGSFLAWFTSFFIYGQFTAMCQMGVFNDLVRRVLVTAVFFAFFGVYYWVTRLYMIRRPNKNAAFWLGMLHAGMGLLTAFVLIFFSLGSDAGLYLVLGISLYPIAVMVVLILYVMIKIAFAINQSDRLRK